MMRGLACLLTSIQNCVVTVSTHGDLVWGKVVAKGQVPVPGATPVSSPTPCFSPNPPPPLKAGHSPASVLSC